MGQKRDGELEEQVARGGIGRGTERIRRKAARETNRVRIKNFVQKKQKDGARGKESEKTTLIEKEREREALMERERERH